MRVFILFFCYTGESHHASIATVGRTDSDVGSRPTGLNFATEGANSTVSTLIFFFFFRIRLL